MSQLGAPSHPFDGPRDFTPYITPSGRRLSEYEALVLFTQPVEIGEERPITKRAGWPEESTRVKAWNWYAFRDPAQMWQRPYVKRQAEQERAIERATVTARAAGHWARVDDAWWRAGFGDLYVPFAFFEHGLLRSLNHASIGALSDSVSFALSFDAVDKERHAQDIIFLHHDLIAAGVDAVGEDPRRGLWLESPPFQPLRQLGERLMATSDWCEAAVAINLLVEPLLERFLCQEVLLPAAAGARDLTTPTLLSEAESDRQRNVACFSELTRMLLADERNATHNHGVLTTWVDEWTPHVLAAIDGLLPNAKDLDIDATTGRDVVIAATAAHLDSLGLRLPV